jgi:5-methylcytosine-specific restriction protein A
MRTFLLNWNPKQWPWDYIHDSISKIADEGFVDDHWSCGNRRDIDIGDRIFLIRLRVEPRGLIASGHVTSQVFDGPHWDETRAASGDTTRFVNVRFDAISETPVIPIAELDQPPLNSVHWHSQSSGTQIEDDTARTVEQRWHTGITSSTHAQPEGTSSALEEGKKLRVVTTAYERSQGARRKCLQRHGCSCACCGILLAEKYGAVAVDFIHVHHKVPISSFGESHVIDPVADLIPVCPTCHSIIHLKNPPLEVEEVRALLESHSA